MLRVLELRQQAWKFLHTAKTSPNDPHISALKESEQRFRDIAELAGDWIWELDAELRFTYFTGNGREWKQLPTKEVLGKTPWEFADAKPNDDDRWGRLKADMEAHRPFRNFRFETEDLKGRKRYFSINGKPIFDDDGGFRGYRGTASNETERAEAVQRARRAEALLRDAIESISEGFVVYDRDDRFVMCNKNYREMYPESSAWMTPGTRFEDVLRAGLGKGLYPDAKGREEEWLAKQLRAHRKSRGSLEQRLSDGRWVLTTERRMRNGGIAGLRIDITALKQAEHARRQSEDQLRSIAENLPGMIFRSVLRPDGTSAYTYMSHGLWGLYGIDADDFLQGKRRLRELMPPEDAQAYVEAKTRSAARQIPLELEYRLNTPKAGTRWLRTVSRPTQLPQGDIQWDGVALDITELRAAEERLHQSQKMESIGNLTGGIAHDFNNILTTVIGNLDLVLDQLAETPATRELVDDALDASVRGAELTKQLLAFARKQPLNPSLLDINALIRNSTKLLGRTLGEDIKVALELPEGLWPIYADGAQIEAAVLNLAINARDAMPSGGMILVSTENAHLDEDYAASNPDVAPGDYTALTVSDTGRGMPPEVLAKAFEPFFTTKEPGKGTGLGLAMVFGFAKQSGGHVKIYSEVGHGTAVKLYLPRPRITPEAARKPGRKTTRSMSAGGKTILAVEDNPQVRKVVVRQLQEMGFRVLEAENAEKAIALLEAGEHVDLVFSDVVMPGKFNGGGLAHELGRRWPAVKVLLTSGFPQGLLKNSGKVPGGINLLNKPYRKQDLEGILCQLLDG